MGKASTFFAPKHQKSLLGFPDTKTVKVLLAAVEAYVFFLESSIGESALSSPTS